MLVSVTSLYNYNAYVTTAKVYWTLFHLDWTRCYFAVVYTSLQYTYYSNFINKLQNMSLLKSNTCLYFHVLLELRCSLYLWLKKILTRLFLHSLTD